MVGNAEPKQDELSANPLRLEQVVGRTLAAEIFKLVDAIWDDDGRIRELGGKK